MAFDIVAHLVELLLGPVFLLLHAPELNVAFGDVSQLLQLVAAGDVSAAVTRVIEGQFDVGTRTLSSLVGTGLWVALVAGGLGELGETGELLELFG